MRARRVESMAVPRVVPLYANEKIIEDEVGQRNRREVEEGEERGFGEGNETGEQQQQ